MRKVQLQRKKLFLLLIFIITTALLSGCQIGPPSDRPTSADILRAHNHLESFQTTYKDKMLNGVKTFQQCDAAVLFIHGTPGSWATWQRYMTDEDLFSKAQMISVDRPGFGQSTPNEAVVSLAEQADAAINIALTAHPGPFILVGHSYGGPVQIQLAQDYPEHVKSMVILAGAIDPEQHGPRWYHHLGSSWLGQFFINDRMQTAADEMLALRENLVVQSDRYSEIDIKTTLIQGGEDWLVPPENADYAREKLPEEKTEIIFLPEQNHFLPWGEYPLTKRKIIEHLGSADCRA